MTSARPDPAEIRGPALTRRAQIDACNERAWALRHTDPELASEECLRALELATSGEFEKQPCLASVADSYTTQGFLEQRKGRLDKALVHCLRASALQDALPVTRATVHCQRTLMWVHYFMGNFARALASGNEALQSARRMPGQLLAAAVLDALAVVHSAMGNAAQALAMNAQALAIARAEHDALLEVTALNNQAVIQLKAGQREAALAAAVESLRLSRRTNAADQTVSTLDTLGEIHLARGDYAAAAEVFAEALALSDQCALTAFGATGLMNLGIAHLRAGRLDEAEGELREAVQRAEASEARMVEVDARRALTEVLQLRGNMAGALEQLRLASDLQVRLLGDMHDMHRSAMQADHEIDLARRETERLRSHASELERELVERKLREYAEQATDGPAKGLYDLLPFMVGTLELRGDGFVLASGNRAAARLFLASSANPAAGATGAIDPRPRMLDRWQEECREVQATGLSRQFEFEHPTPEGPRRLDVSLHPLPRIGGEPLRIHVVAEDVTEKAWAMAALRLTEERQKTILQAVMEGFWLVDMDGRILQVNEAYCRMSGYGNDELLGMTIASLEDHGSAAMTAARTAVIRARGEDRYESRHRRKDGTLFDVEVSVQYRPGEGGRMVVFLRDITERKQALEQLRERERLLAQAESLAKVGSWQVTFGRGGAPDRWSFSARLGALFGTLPARKDPIKSLLEHVPEPDRARFASCWEATRQRGVPSELEHRMVVDGETRWMHGRAEIVRDDEGVARGARGTMQDITERKHIEMQSERERTRLATILQTASDGIHILDGEGVLVEANDAFLRMLGRDRTAVGRLHVTDWDTRESWPDIKARIDELLVPCGHTVFETRHLRSDGTWLDVEINASGMTIEGRHYVCAASRDITQRKQTDAELERHRHHLEEQVESRTAELQRSRDASEAANRAKSVFLANMSHELRTPMNGIMGMLNLALSRATDAQQAGWLGKGLNAAQHLLAVINDVLDISKIEAGQLALANVEFNVRAAIDEVVQGQADAARAKGLDLWCEIAADVPECLRGDATRLKQILLNFLGNAVKFSERGRIAVRVRVQEDDGAGILLRLEVADQGIGISPAQQARLFQAFTQADESIARKYGGTGLGLVISRRLARLMDGDVGVSSREGEGSTFWATMRLRRVAPRPAEASDPPADSARTVLARDFRGARVLLVEDEPVNREVATYLLADAGLELDVAVDGQQAVDLARKGGHAAILMDVYMPVMNGLDATRAIRRLPGLADLPILAMTANAFSEDRDRCIEAGMNDHIAKPVSPEVLYATLVRWLRRPPGAA